MKKIIVTSSLSLLLLANGACAATTPVPSATVPATHASSVSSKKQTPCVNNLLCVKGKTFVCVNGKPTCVSVSSSQSSKPAHASSSSVAIVHGTSVTIRNFAFSPQSLTVKKGTTVTWTNGDAMPHTVTGDSGGPGSSSIASGKSYSYTFSAVGSFPYHCAIHPQMKATVTVIQ